MNIAIVADAACDLPKDFIADHHIEILPIHLRFGKRSVTDVRDPDLALRFYRAYIAQKNIDAETTPLSPQETAAFFKRVLVHYDRILCITVTRQRSKIYENAVRAAIHLRTSGGGSRVQVIDSNSLFAGEAVVVAAAVELAAEGATFERLVDEIRRLPPVVQAYATPQDLYYLRARARRRGDKSVGFLRYVAGQTLDIKPIIHARGPQTGVVEKARGFDQAVALMFDRAIATIKHGLRIPVLAVSYAGNPKEVLEFPKYRELAVTARSRRVKLLIAVMSPTGGVYLGPGALTFGFVPGA